MKRFYQPLSLFIRTARVTNGLGGKGLTTFATAFQMHRFLPRLCCCKKLRCGCSRRKVNRVLSFPNSGLGTPLRSETVFRRRECLRVGPGKPARGHPLHGQCNCPHKCVPKPEFGNEGRRRCGTLGANAPHHLHLQKARPRTSRHLSRTPPPRRSFDKLRMTFVSMSSLRLHAPPPTSATPSQRAKWCSASVWPPGRSQLRKFETARVTNSFASSTAARSAKPFPKPAVMAAA